MEGMTCRAKERIKEVPSAVVPLKNYNLAGCDASILVSVDIPKGITIIGQSR